MNKAMITTDAIEKINLIEPDYSGIASVLNTLHKMYESGLAPKETLDLILSNMVPRLTIITDGAE